MDPNRGHDHVRMMLTNTLLIYLIGKQQPCEFDQKKEKKRKSVVSKTRVKFSRIRRYRKIPLKVSV